MGCNKKMNWERAMRIARKEYPRASLKRRRKIAGSILGGSRKKK